MTTATILVWQKVFVQKNTLFTLLLAAFWAMSACYSPRAFEVGTQTTRDSRCVAVPELSERECELLTEQERELLADSSEEGFVAILIYLLELDDGRTETEMLFEKVVRQWPERVRFLNFENVLERRFEERPSVMRLVRTVEVDLAALPQSALSLPAVVQVNEALTHLVIWSDEASRFQEFLSAGQFTNLRHLQLQAGSICADEVGRILRLKELQQLESLSIEGFRHCTETREDIPAFHELGHLRRLSIRPAQRHRLNTEVLAAGLAGLHLDVLELVLAGVTDDALENVYNLKQFQNLRVLNLTGNPITNQGFRSLLREVASTDIEVLDLTAVELSEGYARILFENFPEQVVLLAIVLAPASESDWEIMENHRETHLDRILGFD